jgi:predicted DNA-binding protein
MATISEAVIREILEKSIKEQRSVASILKERGIKAGRFYGAKKRLDARESTKSSKVMIVKAREPVTQMSLIETLEYLKLATENLERIFKGFKQ